MRAASRMLVWLLLAASPHGANAVLLHGEVEGVTNAERSRWRDYFGNGTVPFGIDPDSLGGVPLSVRFWIETDALPADSDEHPLRWVYVTYDSDPAWLRMEIEINGFVRSIGVGERVVNTFAGFLQVTADRSDSLPGGSIYYPEYLSLAIGDGDPDMFQTNGIPTDLDLTEFPPPLFLINRHYWQQNEFDPISGAHTMSAELMLEFDLLSLSLHPVPEPAVPVLVLLAASLLGIRARVSSRSR